LAVVDIWSLLCPIIRVCRSATAMEVIHALEQARQQHGLPTTIRVDQGSQFTSKELDLWAYADGITLHFSRPGKPTDNACVESLTPRFGSSASVGSGILDLEDARKRLKNGVPRTTKWNLLTQLVTGRRCLSSIRLDSTSRRSPGRRFSAKTV